MQEKETFIPEHNVFVWEEEMVLSAKDANGSVKYDFFPLEKFYTYVNALVDYNRFQDLNLRTTLGTGLGYQVFEDDRKELSFEFGASYFNEDFRDAEDASYGSGRWSVNASVKVIPKKISLFHFHEGYLGFDDPEDLYISAEQGIRFNVLDNFYTTIQYNVSFDNTPAEDLEKTDTSLIFGLGYTFDLS